MLNKTLKWREEGYTDHDMLSGIRVILEHYSRALSKELCYDITDVRKPVQEFFNMKRKTISKYEHHIVINFDNFLRLK